MKNSLLVIALIFLIFNISCKKDPISSANTAPTASFTVNPTTGTTATTLTFDASGSTDNEDATTALQVRWDWENDGLWDTDYSTIKIATHQYSTIGTYIVTLEVKDSEGLVNSVSQTISVDFNYGSVSDIDGNTYKTIQIGNQEWMAENLKVTQYQNGEVIQSVSDNTQWSNLSTGAYCSYENSVSNISIYGLLYNWYAVDDSRGLTPIGWHIPSDEEWKELEMYLGISQTEADDTGYRGTDEGGKLKETGTTHWGIPNTGATNSSGFTALPGGYRYSDGDFNDMGDANLWSSSSTNLTSNYAWGRRLFYDYSDVFRTKIKKQDGLSIRCVRD